jgi:hypothetical protein
MSKSKKHNFSFGLTWRDKKKEDHKECSIYLFYSYGTKHTKQSTNVKIPKGAWNDKKKEIDIDNYPFLIEQQKTLLNIWKNKFEITNKLKSGKMSRITAFEEINERVPNKTLRQHFIEKHKSAPKLLLSSYNQRLDTLRAIENKFTKLGFKEFVPITFDMMSDVNTLEKMHAIMLNDFGLKNNGLYEYLGTLDMFYNKRYKKASPFSTNDLIPSYDEPEKTGIEYEDLLEGIYKINTIQDLETYLMFLYSFALRGLNGIDIFRMADEDFVPEEGQTLDDHYIPNVDMGSFAQDESYTTKVFYQKVRGKKRRQTSKKMNILANLYPTNHIREWLRWCVRTERPELASGDNDGFAIFRKFNEKEVEKIWSRNLRTTYKNKSIKLFGTGIGSARHTYTQAGLEAGIPYEKLQASVGHTPSNIKQASIKKYARYTQQELELIQIEVFDEISLIDIFHSLYDHLKDKKPYRADSFIPPGGYEFDFYTGKFTGRKEDGLGIGYELRSGMNPIDSYMKDKGRLGIPGWSYLEEFKLKKMMRKYDVKEKRMAINQGLIKKQIGKNNSVTYIQNISRKLSIPMPLELKELVERKEKLLNKNKKSFIDSLLEKF